METGIIYKVYEQKGNGTHCVYAQAQSDKTVTWDFIVRDVADNTTYSDSEIRGTFDEVMKVV